jgi:hypothetical protein
MLMRYSVDDLLVRVDCENERLATQFHSVFTQFGLSASDRNGTIPDIKLRAGYVAKLPRIPDKAVPVARQYGVRIFRSSRQAYFLTDGAVASFHQASASGELSVRNGRGEPSRLSHDFLLHCLLFLLHGKRRYVLHAACTALHEQGCLLVGVGGSGKSTLAFALMRNGWKMLSDDVILLAQRENRVNAVALRTDVMLPFAAGRHYDDLPECPESAALTGDSKMRLNISARYPGALIRSCTPRILLFPRIVDRPLSRLVPITRAEALAILLSQSALALVDTGWTVRQLELMKRLIGQCATHILQAGRDLNQDPALIARLVPGEVRGGRRD